MDVNQAAGLQAEVAYKIWKDQEGGKALWDPLHR